MLIAIASGKGGTGKTTLSVNLAHFLANEYAKAGHKILLADLDVEEPNSGIFLNGEITNKEVKYRLVPKWDDGLCTLCKRCANICQYNALAFIGISVVIFPELCHSCYLCSDFCPENALPMTKHRMGELTKYKINNYLDFVESRLDIGVEQATPLIKETKKYIEQSKNQYKTIILDSPPGTSCPVMEAVKDVDIVILVTEPTPFGLYDLKLAVETMKELNKQFVVVINKYGIGNNDIDNYCKNNEIQIIGKIPHLRAAASLYSDGDILIDKIPEIQKEISSIAKNLQNITS